MDPSGAEREGGTGTDTRKYAPSCRFRIPLICHCAPRTGCARGVVSVCRSVSVCSIDSQSRIYAQPTEDGKRPKHHLMGDSYYRLQLFQDIRAPLTRYLQEIIADSSRRRYQWD